MSGSGLGRYACVLWNVVLYQLEKRWFGRKT